MNRLKELREKRGINMRQMAHELNIPYTTYVNYEKGDREPNSETLIKLADFLGSSIDYIIGRESPCHICGFEFFNTKDDIQAHEIFHDRCLKAIKKYGFYWAYKQRENIKVNSDKILKDEKASKEEKIIAAENICKSYFSRSLNGLNFDYSHPYFEEYAAMLLNQPHFQEKFNEVFNELKNKYGLREGIENGKTSWKTDKLLSEPLSNTGIAGIVDIEYVKRRNKDNGHSLYDKLDDIDKAEIRGEMKQMLKSDKYN